MTDRFQSEPAATAEPGPEPQAPDPQRWKALALLCVTGFMVILDSQIVILALPSIERELQVTAGEGQWVLSAYMLTFGSLLLFGGRLADLRGRRPMFIVGTVLFLVSSLLCGLAWSAGALIGARVVQGISAAIMAPSALAILTNMFPDGAERNKALAYWSGASGLGATAALLIGGPITASLGWEWIFYLNVPVAVGLLVFAPVLLPKGRERDQVGSYDPAGALTITLGLLLLTGAIVWAPSEGWTSGPVVGMLLGSVVLIGLFIVVESRSAAPLMPLRMFRSRLFVGGNLAMVFFAMTALGMSITLSAYAQRVLGYTPMQFGLGLLVMTLMTLVGAYAGQAGVTKFGFRPVAAVGIVLMGIGAFLLSQVPADGTYFGHLFPGLLLFGLGLGGGPVAAISAALSSVDAKNVGVASGAGNAAFQIGGALGAAVVSGVVVSQGGDSTVPTVMTEGFQAGFTADLVIALIGLGVALVLLRPLTRHTRDTTSAASRSEDLSVTENRRRIAR
ncbi:drug resistance transporter, EmrB/QacA subfamily [Streptosporangium subroseum]|uniref:Drug resistance transporter, EmrB/QacA subfamily n=1 Tax=Streptosporangium subroseum TaxID=106412 RepID=A0A239LHL6_9ACTN|nr:MFS transporter [Streptosporangium subroseum]SNT29855.1 drug resistance transporter, EmrB/QacA subfamily [Streptosporangium subroseum]